MGRKIEYIFVVQSVLPNDGLIIMNPIFEMVNSQFLTGEFIVEMIVVDGDI